MAKRIVIYTRSWCPDCRSAKKFLASKDLPYEEIDIEKNPDAAAAFIIQHHRDSIRPTGERRKRDLPPEDPPTL